jgi:type IV pilus assembly protein PilC
MSLMQALEITARVVGNKLAFNGIMFAREEMRKGMDLAGPLKKTTLFPPMVDSMIRIGEESGTLEEILESTASFYDEEVDAALTKLTGLLEPAMLIFMAVIIGFIVISMAMPMFALVDTVK